MGTGVDMLGFTQPNYSKPRNSLKLRTTYGLQEDVFLSNVQHSDRACDVIP